jgi:starvation-inducible DNA-binding protein
LHVSTSRTDHPAVRSTLEPLAQDAVASRLQPLLVDLLDLSLTGKQLHWTVVGPQFRALHEQLDELVTQYRTWSDQVAERLSSIGVAPDGRLQRVAGDSPADPVPDGWLEGQAVVRELAARIEAVARRTRTALDGLGEHDLVSEGLLTEILEGLEMQLWMVSAQQS